jgi:hypothetical protein
MKGLAVALFAFALVVAARSQFMNTIVLLVGIAFMAFAAVLFVFGLCAAAKPVPRNTRRHRLGELLECSHPEWN